MDSDSSDSSGPEDWSFAALTRLKSLHESYPYLNTIQFEGDLRDFQNMTNANWKVLGKYIANKRNLDMVRLNDGALNDLRMTFLFQGWTRGNNIEELNLK